MTESPVLQIRHTEKDEWFVAAKWPDGRTEDIRGFKTESEANEWVANELQSWLEQRKEDEAPKKHPNTERIGGPGASHENRKQPAKSKPHGELKDFHPRQGNTKRTAQGKSGGDGREHS